MIRQNEYSHIPKSGEFLVVNQSKKALICLCPFEGKIVNEILATLIAYRIGKFKPITLLLPMIMGLNY